MKLAITTPAAFVHGGMSRVMESWARVLGSAGHDVTVVTPQTRDAIPVPELPGVSARTYPVDEGASRFARVRGFSDGAVAALRDLDRASAFDAILVHDVWLAHALRGGFPDRPLLLTIHSPVVDENRLNNWKYAKSAKRRLTYPLTWAAAWTSERLGLRAASAAHTLSAYTWSLLRGRHRVVCDRVPWERIPGTYDDRRFVPAEDRDAVRRRLGVEPGRKLLLTVRRLVPRNGVDRILAAAERLGPRDDVLFAIGGAGELRDELDARAAERSLGDRVRFLGLVPEADLAAWYQAADAFLMPTRDLECFGLPTIEAMACGTTPLVMPDGGPAEVCRPFPGTMAKANSTDAFVALVERWIEGGIELDRGELARHARETYAEEAVRPAILDRVERVARRET